MAVKCGSMAVKWRSNIQRWDTICHSSYPFVKRTTIDFKLETCMARPKVLPITKPASGTILTGLRTMLWNSIYISCHLRLTFERCSGKQQSWNADFRKNKTWRQIHDRTGATVSCRFITILDGRLHSLRSIFAVRVTVVTFFKKK